MIAPRMSFPGPVCLLLATALIAAASSLVAAEHAKGKLTFQGAKKSFTLDLKHAYLVSGPDTFDEKRIIRRLVFTVNDFTAPIKEAKGLGGFDGSLMEGMVVNLDGGPRLTYWLVLDGQLVQYSGIVEPSALKAKVDVPDHLAGKLVFDDSSSSGPNVAVEFDAPLLKSFTKAE